MKIFKIKAQQEGRYFSKKRMDLLKRNNSSFHGKRSGH